MRALRSTPVREKDIENSILQWLNLQPNTFAFKVNTTGIYDPQSGKFRTVQNKYIAKGCSDILGLLPGGIFLAIEVKTPTTIKRFLNKPTESDFRQQHFLNNIILRKGVAMVASSLEEVMNLVYPYIHAGKQVPKRDGGTA